MPPSLNPHSTFEQHSSHLRTVYHCPRVHAHVHAQSCLALCDPMNCSPPGSSVHRILQARIVEWVATPFSRESSPPKDWTRVSCISSIAGRFFTAEPLRKPSHSPHPCLFPRPKSVIRWALQGWWGAPTPYSSPLHILGQEGLWSSDVKGGGGCHHWFSFPLPHSYQGCTCYIQLPQMMQLLNPASTPICPKDKQQC